MQFGEAMKDEKYNENETINDQISDVSDVSEVKTFKLNSKIDAIKRAEKAKLEDIRNLLGLNLVLHFYNFIDSKYWFWMYS